MNNIEELFTEYIEAYSAMNLEQVASLFDDEIHLRDWKISVRGKETAVAETRKNFESSAKIEIEILEMYASNNTVAGELRIVVDESEVLYVVDVITFNQAGLITSIRAYLGRED